MKRAFTIMIPDDCELMSVLQAVCVKDSEGRLSNTFANYSPEDIKKHHYVYYGSEGSYGSRDGKEYKKLPRQTSIHSGKEESVYPTLEDLYRSGIMSTAVYNALHRGICYSDNDYGIDVTKPLRIDDICKIRRVSVASFKWMGKKRMAELDKIMKNYGLKYKGEK